MKTVVTVTGIRPDFIRMSKIFKELDNKFNHILIHTGQHYDKLLSDVFFNELQIRCPDYNLGIGSPGSTHYEQSSHLSIKLIEQLKEIGYHNIDCVIYLGDSNSVTSAMAVKKEGLKVAHIEAGMRSGDKRMLEEINRIVCDHCSDFLFTYHDNYNDKLSRENITRGVFNYGNTIVEVIRENFDNNDLNSKSRDYIGLDIHRPENFKYKDRLINILNFANSFDLPVKLLNFSRTIKPINDFNIDWSEYQNIEVVDLMSYKEFLQFQWDSYCMVSDSGTAQEEPALLNTPVIVPRDYTERPESVYNGCSIMVNTNKKIELQRSLDFIDSFKPDIEWLGNGNTSKSIANKLEELL
jgi:UDP-N-acetylglucosamine 2-epimerase